MPVYYNRKENIFSDHRPVLGIFQVDTVKIDKAAKEELRAQLLKALLGQSKITSKTVDNMGIRSSVLH